MLTTRQTRQVEGLLKARRSGVGELLEFTTGSTTSTDEFNFAASMIVVPLDLPKPISVSRATVRAYHLVGTSSLNAAIYKVAQLPKRLPQAGVAQVAKSLDLDLIAKATSPATIPSGTIGTLDLEFDRPPTLDPAHGKYMLALFDGGVGNTRYVVDGKDWGFRSYFDANAAGLSNKLRVVPWAVDSGRIVVSLRSLNGLNFLGR